ncbi:MAG: hypothetical protein HC802_00060 [Caldilineaceae bacterium]|nr:hypothetical protein [Caldilineaceae bacterium]
MNNSSPPNGTRQRRLLLGSGAAIIVTLLVLGWLFTPSLQTLPARLFGETATSLNGLVATIGAAFQGDGQANVDSAPNRCRNRRGGDHSNGACSRKQRRQR